MLNPKILLQFDTKQVQVSSELLSIENFSALNCPFERMSRTHLITTNVDGAFHTSGKKTGDMSLETALALIQTAASEMEEDSDKTAQKFLDSEIELDDFLDQFLTKRKIVHTRLVKAEKLAKMLSRDPTLNNIPNYINAPPVNINSSYFPGVPTHPVSSAVPYPTGPLNMPMPPAANYFQNHY